ncbi:PIG-L deacetylase family protein [Methanolobus sp. ZRKC3]|uniref:PIG-L deacetylase family protein n=1 Tax=Methanolobus sp. ZRKC3 TaxID=3125786 RepID=UPI003246D2F1
MNQKNILAVGAHPDDIEIGCGGAVAQHIRNKDNVIMVVMTDPYFTYHDGKVLRDSEEGKLETIKGAKKLGAQLIHLDFETKNVPYSSITVESINKIIDDYNIDTIYTHWYHDTHQDHMRTTQAVMSAGRYVPNILMYEPEYPAGRSHVGFRNQYYVDITETIDLKMEALAEHKSQVGKYGEHFLEAVRARARHRGYEINGRYAECFEVIRLKGDI